MISLVIGIIYLALHFSIYAFCLRFHEAFAQEKIIFLYHFFSCVIIGLLLLGCFFLLPFREALILTICMAGLHGIYSISFLELWALSQDCYSLRILFDLRKKDASEETADSNFLKRQCFGKMKIEQRIQNLQHLGLITAVAELYQLTYRGLIAARLFKAIIYLTASERLEKAS